ncbi:MAG: transposase [Lachnospiraceae bacterium]|nr:transposase [Lachnospiraceae bacterium]
MPAETLCKTIHQYSKLPIPKEEMDKLLEIAVDYCKVKNCVYSRYGGIGSLKKLYPGYTVQNEMTKSGLRTELGLPAVYFYLAVFEALGEIKSQWSRTKAKVLELAGKNENFTQEEKHYIRFLLRVPNAFEAVLNQRQPKLPKEIQKQYESLTEAVETDRLNRYLCRQVRKYHKKPQTDAVQGFSISERAYRYGENGKQYGIYISTKEARKRVFVALTDRNSYRSQLYIKLKPQEARIEIAVPLTVAVRNHEDYVNYVGVSMGFYTMLTSDKGHSYGEQLGAWQTEYAQWIRGQQASYRRNRAANPGRKKYEAQKRRYSEQLHSYINHELNRFFQEEKPQVIYMVKLPWGQSGGVNRKINSSVSLWPRGYIRERMKLKCKEQAVELIEVLGKDISRECSSCGAIGQKENGWFACKNCGYQVEEKTNTARNVLNRGQSGRTIN